MKNLFRILYYIFIVPPLLIILLGLLWLNVDPEFGGAHSSKDVERYETSNQFEEGIFVNAVPTSMDLQSKDILPLLKEFLMGASKGPEFELPVEKVDSTQIAKNLTKTKVLWFGHSAVLLQIDGKNILLDPMLGESPAPHPAVGTQRYYKELPIEIEKLPKIDLILISHDHYDHLDYGSIMKLKEKTSHFILPLGVGAHFRAWDIPEHQITELDWWEEKDYLDLKIAFTPSRHFSGRGLHDRSKTLWGSYVIQGKKENIYFSGDGGYADHFKAIGEKYGPFDFAMLECGQYDEKWAQIHMMPEETAQAGVDLKAKRIMPIHWGAFTLALHHWTDPIVRVQAKAQELQIPLVHPKIGSYFSISDTSFVGEQWWE